MTGENGTVKRIGIYCVSFNSYQELYRFLASVEEAASFAASLCKVDVFVADNTVEKIECISVRNVCASVHIYPFHENLGYLGAVQRMMSATSVGKYDYVAVSNVDLAMDKEALQRLVELNVRPEVGWIAPCLFSRQLQHDRNPSLLRRYSRKRLEMLRFMFSHPWLNRLYKKTFYRRKRQKQRHEEGETIYAGHGSFMILTKEYFRRCGVPDYAMFLFCEELYFAERCRLAGLSVVYCPSVRLWDDEHVSVGSLHSSVSCRYNKESLEYILQAFY